MRRVRPPRITLATSGVYSFKAWREVYGAATRSARHGQHVRNVAQPPAHGAAHLDGLLGVGLLPHADSGVGDQNEENHERLHKGLRLVLRVVEDGQHERHDGRAEQDLDEVVVELLEDKLPQRRALLLRHLWGAHGARTDAGDKEGEGASRAASDSAGRRATPLRPCLAREASTCSGVRPSSARTPYCASTSAGLRRKASAMVASGQWPMERGSDPAQQNKLSS